jgi:hypothetical protein
MTCGQSLSSLQGGSRAALAAFRGHITFHLTPVMYWIVKRPIGVDRQARALCVCVA